MGVYHYRALGKDGLTVIGLVKAESRYDAEHKIKAKKLEIVSLESRIPLLDKLAKRLSLGHIGVWEKSASYRQIATMIKAGVPLVRALQVVAQTHNIALQQVMLKIVKDVREGEAFSEACGKHPKIFNRVDVNILAAGEATGTLDKVLWKLADEKEKEAELRKKIQGAMTYPIFVIVVIVGVVAVMITSVVPILEETFAEANVTLPWTTRTLIFISSFLINFWWLIIIFIGAIIALGIFYVRATMIGKYLWSLTKLKFPVFGKIHQFATLAQICNTLALLISSGVPIVQAIKLTSGVTGNEIFRKSFLKIGGELERGVPVSATLEIFGKIFPAILVNMVNVGEESGTTDQMLITIARYYEGEVDARVKTLSSSLEPMIIVILALGVAFVVFSIMMPIYSLTQFY